MSTTVNCFSLSFDNVPSKFIIEKSSGKSICFIYQENKARMSYSCIRIFFFIGSIVCIFSLYFGNIMLEVIPKNLREREKFCSSGLTIPV